MQQKGIVQKAANTLERNLDASCVRIGEMFLHSDTPGEVQE